jgi:TolA-binding protein
MREVDDELGEIKREIIESRGLVIKTNNLTNALSADLKSIAKRQQSYEQRLSWNSATAYIVFVLVVFTALKFAWDARVDSVTAETSRATSENERLRKENRELEKREEAAARAEAKAQAFYELVRANKRTEIIDSFEGIKNEPLTKTELAIFAEAAEKARTEIAREQYQLGQDKAHLQRWQEAATAFEDSLRFKDDSAVAPQARLGLAECYRHLARPKDAIPLLQSLLEAGGDKELEDDALYSLARAETDLQEWNDAKAAWRLLLRRFPDSHFVPEARLELAQLAQQH